MWLKNKPVFLHIQPLESNVFEMDINHLRFLYSEDKRLVRALEILQDTPKARLQLKGSVGSQKAFLLSALQRMSQRPMLVVALDKEEAAHLQNDLATLYNQRDILFFPDSYHHPLRFDKLNRTNALQRTESVSKFVTNAAIVPLIVTYPEALFEKVVAPAHLRKSAIQVKTSENLDVNFLTEVLLEYGFEPADFVSQPGQYSIRGGIVDIFSYGNELPYRIELFDETVESIRTFDPISQLSIQKIAFVTIVPNVNTRFKSEDKTSIFNILPENAVLVLQDVQHCIDKLQICFEEVQPFMLRTEQLKEESKTEEATLLEERAFLFTREFVQALQDFATLEWSNHSHFGNAAQVIDCKGYAQPSFSKNMEFLIRHLHQNTANYISNYIFAENPKQLERFYHIFEDLKAQVKWHSLNFPLHEGFYDEALGIACYTDHQIFERHHAYKVRQGFDQNSTLQLKALQDLRIGDYVTHIDHGVGKYAGLEKINIQGKLQEAVRLVYKDNDILYVSIHSLHKISKYTGKDNESPTIHKLGSTAWATTKNKTKRQIKALAFDLIQLYAKRRATPAFAFPPDNYLQTELEASFIYEDTPDQARATDDVKRDMEKGFPMDRLVCGDVGFGKTEIAIRAAFKAVTNGKQVAILVPTTILALQHANTFGERLGAFGATVEYINRFKTQKEKTEIYKKLTAGKIDILIGTHSILNEKVQFKDLGLLIIDEEQKFGVGAKEKMRHLRVNIHTLTLTATPIPRTLQFSLMAARDLSVINTPPPNRQPIHTEVRVFEEEFIRRAIEKEMERGGQVFFLHNRVQNLPEIAALIKEWCPNADVGMAHGQMDPLHLEETLLNFIKGYYEVLVCTNIIETGLDIPNANTIIINNAHHFGLSDLHQLRGRVGRSNKKAYCYLLSPPSSVLTNEARKRLETIEQFAQLGSGLQIAMRDLDIRGAGDLLGAEQSGFIVNIGYETYQKILDEAIQELKESEYKDLFKDEIEQKQEYAHDVQIESDEEMLFPDAYVSSVEERLILYQRLNKLENEDGIARYKADILDRFGKIPPAVENIFEALRIRWVAKKLGFERIAHTNRKLRCYFISNEQSPYYESDTFKRLFQYIQSHTDHRFSMKQSGKNTMLVCEEVRTLAKAKEILQRVLAAVQKSAAVC